MFGTTVLLSTPKQHPPNTNHHVDRPAYCWKLPKIVKPNTKLLALTCIKAYKNESPTIKSNQYISFMLGQDEPNYLPYSRTYAYGFIANIKQCSDWEISVLDHCPDNCIPCQLGLFNRSEEHTSELQSHS